MRRDTGWSAGGVVAGVVLGLASTVAGGAAVSASADESLVGQPGGSVVLVLDGSGSMDEPAGNGDTRMEAAQDGLREVITSLPDDARVGLRVYGSTISDGAGSCEDTEQLVPVDDVDRSALARGVDRLKPLGNTPIAFSLTEAAKDLPDQGPRSIVLVSDGEENCGGDPCEVARDLREQGTDLTVDTVGLQVDQASRDELTCIASAGGGTYYDVQDISRLDSTLKRVSVRAARGYVEAGLPIEGGTTAADPAELDDGQWLDTIGDSGAEYYTIPDGGKGTVHLSVSTRTTSDELSDREALDISLVSSSGEACAEAGASVVGVSNTKSPYAVYLPITDDVKADCGEGPYTLAVEPPGSDVKPLEIEVTTEPEVLNAASLPTVDNSDYSEVGVPEPEGEPTSVLGSVSFTGAPDLAPGRYSDSIVAGETLLYRVADVGWGQQAVCDITLGSSEQEVEPNNVRATQARVYGPFRAEITDVLAGDDDGTYKGEPLSLRAASPVIAWKNREESRDEVQGAALAGDVYCGVSVRSTGAENDAAIGEVPVSLDVSILGDVSGEPEFASPPREATDDKAQESANEPSGVSVWVVAVLAALALTLLLFAAWVVRVVRERRSTT